jgi:hypothetical protein
MSRPAPEHELVARLVDLGAHIDWPASPDLAEEVSARIGREGRAPATTRTCPSFTRSSLGIAALLAIVLVTAIVLLVPGARHAVADWLGVDGIRVGFDDSPPPVGDDLSLGRLVTRDELEEQATFSPRWPVAEGLGEPDEFYLDRTIPGGAISAVYESQDGYPAAPGTSVGLLITEFRGGIADIFFKKVVDINTDVHQVVVDGSEGLWLGGDPHYIYRDITGDEREAGSRMAGNTLLWQKDGVTYRLESALGEKESIELGNSLP